MKGVAFLCLLLFAGNAQAAWAWIGPINISKVYIQSADIGMGNFIRIDVESLDLSPCGAGRKLSLATNPNTGDLGFSTSSLSGFPGFRGSNERILAALLAGKTQDKEIYIKMECGFSWGWVSRYISEIKIK
ncbi:MAG: hypothetical protein MK005_13345 [Alcanivorax sp.]|nr:hypothetical protein [Alcanivorax sp.]